MSKLDEKVGQYLGDLKSKIGEENPDVDLLRKIASSLGPSIYNRDAETVSSSSEDELNTVKKNFIEKKLGVEEESKANEALNQVLEKYGKSNRNKYRVVVYYLLTKHFNKESLFK
ncbi:DUF2853 family protein [Christiangramia salexigens]|uniref:DUF2853 domain-containing protein n=1 Tax=Christiangramia salexigens TaxID=1913577 RepID=A0A1L3J279_9FLAO|nr:DUF2853 family protein [Christiangramia salexigens]APG59234.1 hypothetical protein LPB144_01895 [Christiangramia salexigens]